MLPDPSEAIDLGRAVVADGRLKQLREYLGITRNAMSALLHTNLITYAYWERNPLVNLHTSTAGRVGRFYHLALQEIDMLKELGLEPRDLVSFRVAATLLGVPQEVLLRWFREERFTAIDTGILGLWLHKEDLAALRRSR